MNTIQRRRTVRPQFALHPLGLAALLAVGGTAWALPQGGTVVSGQIQIGAPSAGVQVITQGTQKGIIDWRSFSIASGEKVVFNQVSSSAVTLNRVVGYDPSRILGQMSANGHVFLINPQGIVFGSGARIDVGGMVASSLSLSNADFQAGRYDLSSAPGAQLGAVRNEGTIVAHGGGTVALVAPQVSNRGTIEAQGGRVGLAAVDAVSVDVEGDGLIFFQASGANATNRLDQLGRIRADGGTVEMRAAARATMADTVLNMDGIVQARGLRGDGGTVVIDGGSQGITSVKGRVDASAAAAGAEGGTVKVLGQNVGLFDHAAIDASGDAGGGTVLIGGNYQGKGIERNAYRTFVGADASIRADALATGDGGRVIVWADDITRYQGRVSARGGASGGDGGFAEVSGKRILEYRGTADLGASDGKAGVLLLDPLNIILDNNSGDTDLAGAGATNDNDANTYAFAEDAGSSITLRYSAFQDAANGTSIVLQATNNISFAASATDLTMTNGASLTLQAGNNIDFTNLGGNTIATRGGNFTAQANFGSSASGVGRIIGGTAVIDTSGPTGSGLKGGNVQLTSTGAPTGPVPLGGSISVQSIITSGSATNGSSPLGRDAGSVTITTTNGAITVGSIVANGSAANGGSGLAGGAGGTVQIEVTAATAARAIAIGNTGIDAMGGAGGSGLAADGPGGVGGAAGSITITGTAGSGASLTVGTGGLAASGGAGGAAVGAFTGGTGGIGGTINVNVRGAATFNGPTEALGGRGGNASGAGATAGTGGVGGAVALTSGALLTLSADVDVTGGSAGTAASGAAAGSAGGASAQGVDLTGVGVTVAASQTVDAGAGTISVNAGTGAFTLNGALTTTSSASDAVVIRGASAALDDITTGSSGTVTIGQGSDFAGGVTQTGTGVITTGTLTGSTSGVVNLNRNNSVAELGAFTTGGAFTLIDSAGGLNVTGAVTTGNNGLARVETSGAALVVTATGSVAGTGVTLRTNSANAVTLQGDVDGNAGTVTLDSGAAITQTAGTVSTSGTLTLTAGGAIDLSQTNAIGTLGAVTRGGNFTLVDDAAAGGLTVAGNIGTGGNISITTGGLLALGTSTLTARNGANNATLLLSGVGITQSASGSVLVDTTSTLAGGAGSVTLPSNTNDFGGNVTLTSSVSGGQVTIHDANALTLSTVTLSGSNTGFTAVAGTTLALPAQPISTGTANIDLQAGSGLTTPGTLDTTTGSINLVGVGVTVSDTVTTTSGSVTINAGTGTFTNTQPIAGKGTITITADRASIGADIGDATSSAVTIRPATAGTPINFLFGADGDAALSINATELGHLTDQGANTGALVVGSASSSGTLTIGTAGDPILSVGGGGLSFLGATGRLVTLNRSIELTSGTRANLLIQGDITLSQDTTLDTSAGGGNISLPGSIDGAASDLTLDAGAAGVITVGGPISNTASLTVANSGGATFDAVSVTGVIAVDNTSDNTTVAFLGDVSAGSFTFAPQGYNLTFAGPSTTLVGPGDTAFVFTNLGVVKLGDEASDTLTFTKGFTAAAPSKVTIGGQVTTGDNNVLLRDVTTLSGALLDAGTGTIRIDRNGGALDLGAGTLRSSANGAGIVAIEIVDATSVTLSNIDAVGGASVRLGTAAEKLGSVAQTSGTTIKAGTLDGAVTGAAVLDGANTIATLSTFSTGTGFSLTDSAGGLTVTGTIDGGSGLAEIITGGGALTLSAATVEGNGVRLQTTTAHAIDNADSKLTAGAGTVTLVSGGAISFGSGSEVTTTGALTGSAVGTVDIIGATNAIGSVGAFVSQGALTIIDSAGGLTISGNVRTNGSGSFDGLASITTTGNLTVAGGSVAGEGVTLTATGGTLSIQNDVNGTASGTVTLSAGAGGIQQSSGVVTSNGLSVTTTGAVDLDGSNQIGRIAAVGGSPTAFVVNDTTGGLILDVSISVAGNVALTTNGGALALGANGVSGTTVQFGGDSVAGTGVISATTLSVSADGAAGVSLTNAANTIGTLAASSSTGGDFELAEAGGLAVSGNISASGTLTLTTTGLLALNANGLSSNGMTLTAVGITGSGTIAGGSGTTLLSSGGDLINTSGTVSGANVTFRDASSVTLGAVNASGGTVSLGDALGAVDSVTANGVITASTLLGNVTGTADLDGVTNAITSLGAFTAGGSLLLADGGGLSLTGTVSATAGALTITTTTSGLALGNNAVSAGTTMTLAGVGVTGLGVITAPTLIVTGGAGAVSLTNAANAIGTLGASSGTGFTLADAGGLTVSGDVSAGSGALALSTTGGALALGTSDLTAGTSMALSAGNGVSGTGVIQASSLTVTGGTGAVSLTNTANAIDTLGASSGVGFVLNNSGDLAVTGTVDAGAGQLSIVTTGALNLGTSNISATGTGHVLQGVGITQAGGSVELAGTTTVNAGAGAIDLDSTANDFGGSITLSSAAAVSVADANNLTVGSLSSGASSNVTLVAGAGGGTGNLSLALTGGALNIGNGTLSLTANNGALSLNGTVNAGQLVISADSISLGGSITTSVAGQTYNGATGITLVGNLTLRTLANDSDIVIGGGGVTGGGRSLTLRTNTDPSSVVRISGGVDGVSTLTVTGEAEVSGAVQTTGSQTYNNGITLFGNSTLSAGGALQVTGDVAGAGSSLGLTGTSITINGAMTAISTLDVAGSIRLGGDVVTTGAQSYGGAVTLNADATLEGASLGFDNGLAAGTFDLVLRTDTLAMNGGVLSGSGGAITFATLTNNRAIDVAQAGSGLEISKALFETNGFSSITVGEAGTTAGAIGFGAVVLSAPTTVNTTSTVTFASTVDSRAGESNGLTVMATGTTTFAGAVGGTTPLASLTVDRNAVISGGEVTTSGAQDWGGNVTLGGDTTMTGSRIDFGTGGGQLNTGNHDLTVYANAITVDTVANSTGLTTLAPFAVGGSIGLAGGAGTLSLSQALLNEFVGTRTLQIGRADGTGTITAQALTLPTDVRIVSSSGNVTFGTINGRTDGGQSLTVGTTGLTTFAGAVGGTNALSELTTTGNNEAAPGSSLVDTRIQADIRTTGAQTYNDDVLLVGTRTLTGSVVNFNAGIGGDGIVLRPANDGDTIGIGVAAGEAGFDFRVTQAQLDQLSNFDEVVVGGADGTGAITIRSLSLQSDLTVLGDTAAVNIVGAINGAAGHGVSLSIDTGGLTTVGAGIGQVVPLAGLTIDGPAALNTAAVTTTGTQNWGGALAVNSEATLRAGRVEFDGAVTVGGSALHVFSNQISAAAAISGNTVQLASRAVDGSVGIAGAAGDLQISQALLDRFAGVDQLTIGHGNGAGAIRSNAVTLSTDTLLQSDRGNVTFAGRVDSNGAVVDLTVATGGITTIGGDLGLTGALGTLTIQGATRLSGATRIEAGTVDFGGTVDGARALTITADAATFGAAVGGTTALASLTLAQGAGTAALGGDVTTTGGQSYAGAVVLNGDATLSGSTLSFARTVDSAAGSARALVLNATTRAQLDGEVGSSGVLSSLTVNGETRLNAPEVRTTGAQVYNGAVALGSGAGVLLDAGSVRFASTVDGAGNLTVDSAGLTRFDGDVGGTTELASLRVQGGGTAQVGGDTVRSSGAQSWGGAVVLSGSTTFRAGSLNFGGAVSGADDLTLVTNTLTGATSLSGTGTLSISTRDGGRTIELAPTAANGGRLQIAQAVLTGAGGFDRHVIGSASGSGDIVANALDLAADTVLRTGTGDLALSGRVDGGFSLALNSGGTTTISGPVGTRTALTSLTTDNNAAAADWNGTSGERTVFDKADGSGSARVVTTGAQTYNDPVVSSVPVLFRGGAITATQTANAFGDAVNVDADTLRLASGESITLGNLTVTNDSSVVAGGVLTLKGDIDLQGGTLRLVSNATPEVLPEFSDPEHVGKSFGLTGLGEATATITQTGGSVRTASGTLLVLRAAGNGSISLEGTGNAIAGELSAVAGASGVAPGEPAADQPLSFVRIASTDIRVAGSPTAGSSDDRLGIEGDVVKLTADRLATGADGTIRARLPFRPFFGSNTQIPALTLVLSQKALTVGNQFGSGNDPNGWIRVSLGDSQGAFLTVRPKGAGSDTAFVLLSGDPAIQPFYDGAGKVTEVRVFYNGDTARTAQETGALAAVQAVAEDARQTRFEEAVRTENVRMRLRSGVIAEVGAGRPATVGRESIKLPDNCEPKGKTLECQ